jgi:hypothetical protein
MSILDLQYFFSLQPEPDEGLLDRLTSPQENQGASHKRNRTENLADAEFVPPPNSQT